MALRTQTWITQYPSGGVDTTTQQPTLVNGTDKTDVSQINTIAQGLQILQKQVGKVQYVSDYGNDITKAVVNLSGALGTVVVPYGSTITLTSSYTVPNTVHLDVKQGGLINHGVNNIIISGTFTAPRETVFSGAGSVTFGPSVHDIFPEWWGNIAYSGDCTIALQKALTAAINKKISLIDRVYGSTASLAPDTTTVLDGNNGTIKALAAMDVLLNVDNVGVGYAPNTRATVKNLTIDGNSLATDCAVVSGGANYHKLFDNCRAFGAIQDNYHLYNVIGGYFGPNMYANGAGRYNVFVEGCNASTVDSIYTTGGGTANVFISASHVVNGQSVTFMSLVSEAGSGKSVIVKDTTDIAFISPWSEANTGGGMQFISSSGVIVSGRFNGAGASSAENRWLQLSASNVTVISPSISTQGVASWNTASVSSDSYLNGSGINALKGINLGEMTQDQRGSGVSTPGRLIYNSSSAKVEFDDGNNWYRLSAPITPYTFGAVGDGVTIDDAAFYYADILAQARGEELLVPSGTYKFSSPRTMNVPVKFEEGARISGVGVDLTFVYTPTIGEYQVFNLGGGNKYTINQGFANPKWFGATGDGTTNDLAAILAADTAINAGSGSVVISSGSYKVNSTLTINSHLVMLPGAVFKPANGIPVDARTNGVTLPDEKVFDVSLGGKFLFNSPEYNVRWFGAVGDGVTDDYASLYAAFENATSGLAGAIINLGTKKTYGVSAELKFNDTINIIGGPNTTIKALASMDSVLSCSVNTQTYTACKLRDFGVNANNLATKGIVLERIHGYGDGVYNISAINAIEDGILLDRCIGMHATKLYAQYNGGVGIRAAGCNASNFYGCSAQNNGGKAGIMITTGSSQSGVCHFYSPWCEANSGSGIVIEDVNAGPCIINSGWIEGNTIHGISSSNSNFVFTNGRIIGAGSGVNRAVWISGGVGVVKDTNYGLSSGNTNWLNTVVSGASTSFHMIGPLYSNTVGVIGYDEIAENLGPELLQNEDMEAVGNWVVNVTTNSSASQSTEYALDGSSSYKKTGTDGNNYMWQLNVPLSGGHTYKYTGYSLVTNSAGVLRPVVYNSTSGGGFFLGSGQPQVSGAWERFEMYLVAPHTADNTAFRFGMQDLGAAHDFYIDVFSVREVISHKKVSIMSVGTGSEKLYYEKIPTITTM